MSKTLIERLREGDPSAVAEVAAMHAAAVAAAAQLKTGALYRRRSDGAFVPDRRDQVNQERETLAAASASEPAAAPATSRGDTQRKR